MKCNAVEPLLDLFVGGDLNPAEEQVLREHLDECAGCRQKLQTAERSFEALRSLQYAELDEEVPEAGFEGYWDDMRDSVMERLQGEPVPVRRAGQILWFGSGFVAAASLFLIIWLFFLRGGELNDYSDPTGELVKDKMDQPVNPLERVQGPLASEGKKPGPRIILPAGFKDNWPFSPRLERNQGRTGGELVPVSSGGEDF